MRLKRAAFKRAHTAVAALTLAASFVASGVAAAPVSHPGPKRIQVVAHDESVRTVLLRIADMANLSIAMSEDVRGNVNLTLHDVTAEEAVHAVCSQMRLRCVRDGRTVNVSTELSAVVPLTIVPAARAAHIVHGLYPALGVRADAASNSLVLEGSSADIQGARAIIAGIDVRDATKPTSEAIGVHTQSASVVAERLRALYPSAKITVVSRTSMLVSATPPDLAQIKTLVAGIDAATPAPSSAPLSSDAVKVTQRRPQDVARAVHAQVPHVRAAVSGSTVALSGTPEDVARAKTLIAQIDAPGYGARYVQIYRLKNVDATSVAELIRRSFPEVQVTVDPSLNALSVTATAGDHARIAEGIARLDGTGGAANSGGDPQPVGNTPSTHEVINLQSIIPSQGYGSSTSAQDIAQAVQQALQQQNPDLHVIVPNGTQQLILTGSPQAVHAAKTLIAELDAVPPSVVLDTEILEIDENSSKNLGIQLGTSISTTFSETTPLPDPVTGQPGRLIRFQPLTRTGLSIQAILNLLIQTGKGRVLADPRITTISGRTATIRAGDSISILTTVGGGTGTVATTQLQTFQTGVTLDITPIVTTNGEISVALHPVVNSLSGFLNNVPQISTRDTQTQVHLHDNETLVIGGLIQESTQSQENKIPILGDLPLVGRVFRNTNTTNTRNELIIVVTPHLLVSNPSAATIAPPPTAARPGLGVPTPEPLPTLPPNVVFPAKNAPRAPARAASPAPAASGSPVPSPGPAASAGPLAATTPSAFAQANVYVYGSPPPSTYAGPSDPPVIFYAMFSPTVLTPNSTVRVSAITTTNVQKLRIGTQSTQITLSQLASGTWQGVFTANALNLPPTATSVQLTLTATRGDGQSASIQLPISLMHQEQVL
ncbi:MAG TPA: secretin N-terminal domain-containing protein [Candidatus Elarobacter sp.]|nr:secretin N-terminal domain-containing protein [Candidatus Elarobacter sp.]